MNECERVQEALALRVAGEPEPGGEAALASHLASCRACAEEAERLRALVEGMRSEPAPHPGPVYWASFQARLARRIALRGRTIRVRALLTGLAAGALVVLGLAVLAERRRAPGPPQSAARETSAGDGAEARLEAALGRFAEQGAGEGEFEAILDTLAPADPLSPDVVVDPADTEPSAPVDGADQQGTREERGIEEVT